MSGLGGTGLIPGRDRDRFGVGYYYMSFTDDRVKLILPDNNEKGFEVFYNAAVTPWFELSANLQVLDGALRTSTNTAWVAGLRGRVSF